MSDQNPILQQLTGLGAGVIIGAMILVIGRLLFSNAVIPTYTSNWVQTNYDPAALTVFVTSMISAFFWYWRSYKWWPKFVPKQSGSARSQWILIFCLPIASLVASLFLWAKDGTVSLEFLASAILLVILSLSTLSSYWLATALSTPKNMCHVIPLTSFFRY